MIRIQQGTIDVSAEMAAFSATDDDIGAIVSFTGLVRRDKGAGDVTAMRLEHYPGMTEKKLAEIDAEAGRRWPLARSLIVHRVGTMRPGAVIVLVATASPHRDAAFDAARFLIDWLKSKAPFWKREETATGSRWVAARDSDHAAAAGWERSDDDG